MWFSNRANIMVVLSAGRILWNKIGIRMVKKVKNIANTITITRIIGAFSMLFFKPLSPAFLYLYVFCGISDILDGYIARKTRTVSQIGMVLDSIADLVFLVIAFSCFFRIIAIPIWLWLWIGMIIIIRLASYAVGLVRYHSFAALHTYANKLTGLMLFVFPFLFMEFDIIKAGILLCSISSLSALEELLIMIKSKELNRDGYNSRPSRIGKTRRIHTASFLQSKIRAEVI